MSAFDPSTLMSILQSQGGATPPSDLSGTNKFNSFPSSSNSTPDVPTPSPQAPPAPPASSAAQSPSAPPQQDQRISGVKGYLANILHGVGEGMKVHLGMETDAQKQQRLFTQQLQTQQQQNQQLNTQSEIAYRSAQIDDAHKRLAQQQTAADYARFDVQKDPVSGKFVVFDKSKAIDLLKQGQDPSGAFTSFASRGGTSSIDDVRNHILSEAGVDPSTLSIPERAALAAATFEARTKSDPKPLQDWANNFANRSVKLSPTVTNTTETKEVADPNNPGSTILVKVPKTTTSQKIAPGAPQGQQSTQGTKPLVSLNTTGGIKTLVGQDGQPLQGKSAGDTVYATDPKTGQQIYTTRTQAAAQGLQTPLKVNAAEVRKDQALSNRLADVQRKVGDYAATFDQPIDAQDQQAIAYITDNNIGGGLSAGGIHVNLLPQYVQSQLKARGMQALSENGMKRLIQYNQARESLSGYQQILTNSSRSSDKILELQLEQLPPPLADKQFADTTSGQFQQNIDLAGQHIPIFPGSAETQQSIKAQQLTRRQQTQAVQNNQQNPQQYINQNSPEPPRPANVPQGYVFKANGPKGRGWYRP